MFYQFFSVSFLNIKDHIDNITNNTNTLKKLYNDIILRNDFKYEFNNSNLYNLKNMIDRLDISDYWNKMKNCNINFNEKFLNRKFNYVHSKDKTSNIISSAMSKINKSEDYFDEIMDKKLSKMVGSKDEPTKYTNKYYYDKIGSEFTNDNIISLINYFDNDDIKKSLSTKIFKSHKYCHHILNNINFFETIFLESPDSIKDYQKMSILFSYAWTRFYMDEKLKEGFLNTNDEIVFDINTANLLPYFPNGYGARSDFQPKNPYLPILIKKNKYIKHSNNIGGVKIGNKSLGINTLETFRERLNIFITGSEIINIFNGINFKENKMAITGSVMPACLQKNNPLESNFKSIYRYFLEYYHKSDIDIMIKTSNIFEYINICNNIQNKIEEKYIYLL